MVLLESQSISIQRGEIIMIRSEIYPKGFHIKASENSPLEILNMDLLVPQEGQGIFVLCLIKQRPTLSEGK